MEKFSVSRLIGARPPDMWVMRIPGPLRRQSGRRPYSVVLLDEIEKAHPGCVQHSYSRVLDEGHLTDNYGRVIDFKNTVLIMTSNLGAREISKGGSLGFHDGKQQSSYDVMQAKVRDEIERAFNPEFLNRVDETIVFHTLDRDEIGQIVHILMKEIDERLAEENLTVSLTEARDELPGGKRGTTRSSGPDLCAVPSSDTSRIHSPKRS